MPAVRRVALGMLGALLIALGALSLSDAALRRLDPITPMAVGTDLVWRAAAGRGVLASMGDWWVRRQTCRGASAEKRGACEG